MAVMFCGRYGFSVVADMVFGCGRYRLAVHDGRYCCGRYGRTPEDVLQNQSAPPDRP